MQLVSYNIQYGIGLDGRYDLSRIAAAVRGADLICLQEVSRNNPRNGGRDMVAGIAEALPDYFSAWGQNFEADMGSHLSEGRAVTRTFQLGNMVLSRTPIRLSRNLLLPRTRSLEVANFQRGAVEALVETPLGPLRVYSVHLDHRSPDERLAQVRFLRERLVNYPLEGGALTGLAEFGLPEPPLPEASVAMGDFNMLPGSPEYREMTGAPDHASGQPLTAMRGVDALARLAAPGEDLATWVDPADPRDPARHRRIDYAFVAPALAPRLGGFRIDRAATGSDHLPLWLELG